MKATALEAAPPVGVTATVLAPAARPAGTVAVIEVALQAVVAAEVAPKCTVPLVPRLVPAMVTLAPVWAWLGVRLVSAAVGAGGASTVKATALEAAAPVGVTATVVAPAARLAGTVAVIEVALQAVVAAAVAPKRTVPLVPRLVPAMVTLAPVWAWLGVRLVRAAVGAGITVTVKGSALEAEAPVGVTTTFLEPTVRPAGTVQVIDVALQAVVAAVMPPTVTAPDAPMVVPEIVNVVPTGPLAGVRLVRTAVGAGGASTVKATALEAAPPVGVTVTVVAPAARLAGTVAVIEVALQAVVAAAVAPKRTVPLVPRLVPAMVTLAPVWAWLGVRLVRAAVGPAAGTVML